MSSRPPLAGVLRLGRPSDIWFKPALSVVVAVAPPSIALLALGRLDLAMYTMAGSLCALYAHNRPYAARARALAWVVLGMLGGLAAALVAASLAPGAVVLVMVGAVLAAVQKVLCDAARIGPPGNVVLTFVSSAALFTPQSLAQVPGHLALAAASGAWAWLVGMAPGLLRPHGPERRAVAGALHAAAAYVETAGTGRPGGQGGPHGTTAAGPHATATTAVQSARQALLCAGRPSETRQALERLRVRAEVALAAPADTDPEPLRTWARQVRGNRPVPHVDDLPGLGTGPAAPPGPLWRRLRPLAPLALRVALGCALAGYASLALGIGRPYWALVTAASLYQANLTLTWGRGVQRVVGNLIGVLLFAAVVPVAHSGGVALVLCCLALNFGAEALIGRNYWLGSVCVTPMALLVTEFAGFQEPGRLITERIVDTLVGALLGLVAAVAVPDRRWQRVVRAGGSAPRTLAATGRSRGLHPDQRADQRTGSETTEGVRP
ncbi:FUSC family protein [Streptomyces cyaneochromogenes]|uniref:FUSC family protein n=1 Tax=Streptomyces cyaneochromogenes TaxID=2496836 RepID=A0A3Q9EPE5_9ACTN|nr:FUSC family protein [Streptomyces cyaneochromogenes]AZQ32939.1 FUSC family protein [Streptomyces cyaneochromogenes]